MVVSDLDGGDWKSKGMFITAEESFRGGVVVKNQMFFLKDVVIKPTDQEAEMERDIVMCVLNLDTMESKELRREHGVFFYSISRRNERLSDVFGERRERSYLLSV